MAETPTTEHLASIGLVDCGTLRHKGIGKEVRVVCLDGKYYWWDQDALDREYGLGKYLFRPRLKFEDTPNGS